MQCSLKRFRLPDRVNLGGPRHVIDPCLSSMPLVLCKLQQNICSLILAKCTSLVCDVVCNTKQWAAETRVLILAKHKTSSMFAAVLATTVWFIRQGAGNIIGYEGALHNHGTITISLLSVFRICFNHILLIADDYWNEDKWHYFETVTYHQSNHCGVCRPFDQLVNDNYRCDQALANGFPIRKNRPTVMISIIG